MTAIHTFQGCGMPTKDAVSMYGVEVYNSLTGKQLITDAEKKLFVGGLGRVLHLTTRDIQREAARRVLEYQDVNFPEEAASDLRGNFFRMPIIMETRRLALRKLVAENHVGVMAQYADIIARGSCKGCRSVTTGRKDPHTCSNDVMDPTTIHERFSQDMAPIIVEDNVWVTM